MNGYRRVFCKALLDKIMLRKLLFVRRIKVFQEYLRYLYVGGNKRHNFFVVSCQRNAGSAAAKCLDSVYYQKYERKFVRHIFIDDASTDNTDNIVRSWLARHPDNNVKYIQFGERRGGTANTLYGMELAEPGSIVVELNGDDWLADKSVLRFLNKVYADENVWMTYNTLRYLNGFPALWAKEVPKDVIERNGFRDGQEWITSALHTFRKKLFDHIEAETFIDPQTGELWESSDDQALYLSMLELSGHHSRHLHRVTYVYNFREDSHCFSGNEESEARARRIRQMKRYEPLVKL
jgi:glycosyltransferase involved in cell wall biosynthesis